MPRNLPSRNENSAYRAGLLNCTQGSLRAVIKAFCLSTLFFSIQGSRTSCFFDRTSSWDLVYEHPCSEPKRGQILTHPNPTSTDSLTHGLHELTFIHRDTGTGADLSHRELPGSGSSKEVMASSVCHGGRAGWGQPTSSYPSGQAPSALSCLYLRHVLG